VRPKATNILIYFDI